MKQLLAALALALVALPAAAQTAPEVPQLYKYDFFAQGVDPAVGAPVQSNSVSAALVTCNQAVPPTPNGTVVNPSRIWFADVNNNGRACIFVLNQPSTIFALPIGNYFATVIAVGPTLSSMRSAASNPFSHAVVPVAPLTPTGVTVGP